MAVKIGTVETFSCIKPDKAQALKPLGRVQPARSRRR